MSISLPTDAIEQQSSKLPAWAFTAGAWAFTAGAVVLAVVLIGSASAFLIDFNSTKEAELVAAPAQVQVGELPVGEKHQVSVKLHNTGKLPTRIVGGSTRCDCIAVSALPMDVAPGETVEIPVIIKAPNEGRFSQIVEFQYGRQFLSSVTVTVEGTGLFPTPTEE